MRGKTFGKRFVPPRISAAPVWLAAALAVWASGAAPASAQGKLDAIRLPPGFEIAYYAPVPNARTMAVLPKSRVVIVGSRGRGTVYAVIDKDGDYEADDVAILARRLNAPNGVAYHDGYLYVAEQHRIRRARFDEDDPRAPLHWELVKGGLRDNRHHGTRYLAFSPQGRLYVSLGVPCNVCSPNPPDDGILAMNPDGSGMEVFARGIRNSVGLAFHPVTGHLFFDDNGADGMGDDSPPDELNHAPVAGLHFGFPWYGGGRDRTPAFRGMDPPAGVVFPVVEYQAHTASLGLHFYTGTMFPAEYRNDLFVAQRGSWNRSVPTGYRVTRVRFGEDGMPEGKEIFAEGWYHNGSAWGRPADIAQLGDGSLLVSDDSAGMIYRITYRGK